MHFSEYKRIEKLEEVHFWYKAMQKYVIEVLGKYITKKVKILDAGCGTGGLSQKMMQFGEVIAMDISPTALSYAKKKKISRVIKGSIEAIPFMNDEFDIIVCLDVLYHRMVSDDTKVLSEFKRTLKPGGLLFLRVPAFEFLRGAHDEIVETRHRYTTREIGKKLTESNFQIIKISYANFILSLPLIVKRIIERVYKHHSASSDTFLLPYIINEIFYDYLTLENNLLLNLNLPFGSSVVALALNNK